MPVVSSPRCCNDSNKRYINLCNRQQRIHKSKCALSLSYVCLVQPLALLGLRLAFPDTRYPCSHVAHSELHIYTVARPCSRGFLRHSPTCRWQTARRSVNTSITEIYITLILLLRRVFLPGPKQRMLGPLVPATGPAVAVAYGETMELGAIVFPGGEMDTII